MLEKRQNNRRLMVDAGLYKSINVYYIHIYDRGSSIMFNPHGSFSLRGLLGPPPSFRASRNGIEPRSSDEGFSSSMNPEST